MSFLKKKEYEQRFFPFWQSICYKVEILDMTIELEIFRSSSLLNLKKYKGMIMTPNYLYISRDLNLIKYNTDKIWETLKNKMTPKFLMKPKTSHIFDSGMRELELSKMTWKSNFNNKDQMMMIPMHSDVYFNFINDFNENRSRFFPLASEYMVYRDMLKFYDKICFPSGNMNDDNLLQMINNSQKTYEQVRMFHSFSFLKEKAWEDTMEFMSEVETKTFYDSIVTENLNSKNVKTWVKTRHNMFGISILQEKNWYIPTKFDVSLPEKFSYTGDYSRMTPDYCFYSDDNQTLYLLDFAVTVGSMLNVVDRKKNWYNDLALDLSEHLKMEVKVLVAVWNIKEKDSFYLPDELEDIREKLENNRLLNEIYSMHLKVSSMDNYDVYYKSMDEDFLDSKEELEMKMNRYLNLLSSLTANYKLKGKRTYDASDSRKMLKEKNMKYFKDMDIYHELENASKVNWKQYENSLKNSLKSMMLDNAVPETINSLFKVDKDKMRKKLDEQMEMEKNKRNNYINSMSKIPKLFKFPFMRCKDNLEDDIFMPFLFNYEILENDGTAFIPQKMDDEEKETMQFSFDGIGINPEEDVSMMEDLYLYFKDKNIQVSKKEKNFCNSLKDRKFYNELVETNLWSLVYSVADLMENICYLEGRRFIHDKNRGHTVCKNFGDYILMIQKGSKLTAEKQIRYKLICKREFVEIPMSNVFHSWKKMTDDYYSTKWLTISITDIRHFLKCREVTVSMASDYYDKKVEMNKSENAFETFMDKSFVYSIMILLEHKRGTSTSLQLNRYLLHSATSFATNRFKLIDDINSNPIRSRMEAYVRFMQMEWYSHMMDNYDELNFNRVKNLMSSDPDYDRAYFPSFFDLNLKMEFGMMMNEMYLCNLFDKEAGFMDHRVKQIVNKMTEAEIHFQKIKMSDESMGNVTNIKEFLSKKDELHKFDKNFVITATKKFFNKTMNKTLMADAYLQACTEVVDSAMMMTSSLVGGNYKSEVLKFKDSVEKSKSFLTLYDMLENMPSHLLISMASMEDTIEAIFTIFPKAQIGGPREILIQSVMLRIMVKFLETISKKMCEKHNKEMLTKDKQKAEMQSSQMNMYKDMMMTLKKNKKDAIFASFNSDASRWAPGFVMEHFLHFIYNWEIEESLKEFLCCVVSSFSHKIMLTPDNLRRKWAKKSMDEKEYNESIEYYRQMDYKMDGAPILESGMGQGMFHFLSSFYHCVMDDLVDDMIERILEEEHRTIIHQSSLISSDDKTKMFIMSFEDPMESDAAMKSYLFVLDSCYRLCNIHTNWKKSGLQFMITEFNSLFSIGKRMVWATIKDLYMANSIPDLTAPEEAVKFMLSSIRRCFEHGVYLDTINVMMKLANNQLKRYYRYSDLLINELCVMLNCEEENLPFHLGFLPVDNPVETLIFGPEFHMFKEKNSKELTNFYTNLYTAGTQFSNTRSRHYIPFDETGCGKFWIELPMRLDKRLIEMKNDFYNNRLKVPQEDIIKKMNLDALNVNLSRQDWVNHRMFKESFFVGVNRKYEFQETMVVHSLVRALQLSKGKGQIYPRSKELTELEDIAHDRNNPFETRKKAREEMETFSVDILQFVKYVNTRNEYMSSLNLMEGLREMCKISEEVEESMKKMTKMKRNSHPKMRELRFNMTDTKSSFNKNDLVNFMFDSSTDFRNSTIKSFDKICTLFKVDKLNMWKNPFSTIRGKMKETDYCYKAFIEFLAFHSKISGNVQLRMLSDFPDCGNMKINLINLYRSKTSSMYIYELPKVSNLDNKDLEFLTKMSLSLDPSPEMKEFPEIKLEDNQVTRARKLCVYGVFTDVKFEFVKCERLFYSKEKKDNYVMYHWTDLSFLAQIKEEIKKGEKVLEVKVWAKDRESIEENSNIWAVKRFLLDSHSSSINFVTRMEMSSDELLCYNLMKGHLVYRVGASHYMSKYKLSLYCTKKSNFRRNPYDPWVKFHLMEDNYTMKIDSIDKYRFDVAGRYTATLNELMENPPTPDILDEFLVNMKWIRPHLFEKEEEITEEDMRRAEISFINQQFSSAGVLDLIPKMMGLHMVEKQEEKEEIMINEEQNLFKDVDIEGTLSMLQLSMMEAKKSVDSEDFDLRSKMYETTSVSKVVESMVSKSVNTFLSTNTKIARDLLKTAKSNMERFHNMIIWLLKKEYPNMSDSMLLMMYNIKLKEMSFNTYLPPISNFKMIEPSERTKDWFKVNVIFTKITEEKKEEMDDILSDFF